MTPHIIRPSKTHLLTQMQLDRWPTKYTVNPLTGCWAWTGARFKSGYGQIRVGVAPGTIGELLLAHRVAYEIAFGEIPAGMLVRHACDNRLCVNPDHLALGTNADNMRDMVERGGAARGQRAGNVKLTDVQVLEIVDRARVGDSLGVLSADYGVTKSAISCVLRGISWSHLTGIERKPVAA